MEEPRAVPLSFSKSCNSPCESTISTWQQKQFQSSWHQKGGEELILSFGRKSPTWPLLLLFSRTPGLRTSFSAARSQQFPPSLPPGLRKRGCQKEEGKRRARAKKKFEIKSVFLDRVSRAESLMKGPDPTPGATAPSGHQG